MPLVGLTTAMPAMPPISSSLSTPNPLVPNMSRPAALPGCGAAPTGGKPRRSALPVPDATVVAACGIGMSKMEGSTAAAAAAAGGGVAAGIISSKIEAAPPLVASSGCASSAPAVPGCPPAVACGIGISKMDGPADCAGAEFIADSAPARVGVGNISSKMYAPTDRLGSARLGSALGVGSGVATPPITREGTADSAAAGRTIGERT
jgi:hypothetical protein